MKTFVSFAILLLMACALFAAEPSGQFAKANQEYGSGDFQGAINDYEELVRAGQDAPNLFYNLGNAYFRKKDFGRAILNYERALVLNRHFAEAQANLRIAQDEARALELLPSRSERLFAFANENQLAMAAAIAFWIGIFAIAIFVFNRRRSFAALSIISLSIFAIAAIGVHQLRHGKNGNGLAIVTGESVEARIATADNANRVLTLPAGSEIKIVSQRGDWIYAALPNNLQGWMPAKSAEQVRM
jgi:tetratricopeptide (TPR) repeat protein